MSDAAQVAMRDITAECEAEGKQNCLYWEKDILEWLEIPRPDFRFLNGGWNRGKKKSDYGTN